MRCLVIAPQYRQLDQLQLHDYPLGLCYIAAALRRAGHDVRGLDLTYEPFDVKRIRWAEVVLTGGLCTHWPKLDKILRLVQTLNPNATTVLGGGVVTGTPLLTQESLRPHYSIAGEGENAVAELLQQLTNSSPPRILYGTSEQDLEKLPEPWYEIFQLETYLSTQYPTSHYYTMPYDRPRALATISSRGCPYDCSFCFHPLGRGHRVRDVEKWLAEVDALIGKFDLNLLCVLDEVLGLDEARLEKICDGLKRIGILWMAQLRVDVITDDLAKRLKDAGCYYLSLGIESGSDETLRLIGKHTTTAQIERALKACRKARIGIQGNVLLGFPHETDTHISETLLWWERNYQYDLFLGKAVPYPDSQMWRHYYASGLLDNESQPLKWLRSGCDPDMFSLKDQTKISDGLNRYLGEYIKRNTRHLYADEGKITFDVAEEPPPGHSLASVEFRCPRCKAWNRFSRLAYQKNYNWQTSCRECLGKLMVALPKFIEEAYVREGNRAVGPGEAHHRDEQSDASDSTSDNPTRCMGAGSRGSIGSGEEACQ